MKVTKILKDKIQREVTKKTTDGIIDVLIRMYHAEITLNGENSPYPSFLTFCEDILEDNVDQFYARPIISPSDSDKYKYMRGDVNGK